MNNEALPEVLLQRWMHSHEEDTASEQIFRPGDYDFPPSRGRTGFELKADGTLWKISPGPTDRLQAQRGTWKLAQGNVLILSLDLPPGGKQSMTIVAVNKDKLILKKPTSGRNGD